MKNSSISFEDLDIKVPEAIPVLPLSKVVLFPALVLPIAVEKEHHKKLIEDALNKDKLIGLFLSKVEKDPKPNEIEEYGTIGLVNAVLEILDDANFIEMKNHGFISLAPSMTEAGLLSLEVYGRCK